VRRAVIVAVVLAACPKRRADPWDAAMAAALAAADAAWEARGAAGLEPVAAALGAVPPVRAEHPEVVWRRVRLGIAQALVVDDVGERRRAYARARWEAARCVESRALGAEETAPCAAWGALAWARGFVTWPRDGVSLDEPDVARWAEVAVADPVHARVAQWARALLADPGSPERLALAAWVGEPSAREAWVAWVDLRQLGEDVPRPTSPVDTPEERAALTRALGGLGAP
jgi:hypothetical protein